MKKATFITFLFLISLLFSCKEKAPDKILLVFSYHPEYTWVSEEISGLNQVFARQNLELHRLFMDTKRNTSESWKQKMADSAFRMIERIKPDAIMLFDDNACEYVGQKLIGKETPVVFCGVNSDPASYGFPAENVTGVVERVPLQKMFNLLRTIAPEVTSVSIISDESPTGIGIDEQLEQTELDIEVGKLLATNDFGEWKEFITNAQESVDALAVISYLTLEDTITGKSMDPQKVMIWILENNRLPETAPFDFAVYDGLLCGVYLPGQSQSKPAAEMLLEILDGADPAELPLHYPEGGERMINRQRAEKLGIEVPETGEIKIIE